MIQFLKMKKQYKLASAFALLALLSQVFVGFAFAQEFPQAPDEVQNVVPTPGINQVTLTWDEASDPDGVVNEYKLYYGKNAVRDEEDSYEDEKIIGKVTEYTVENLEGGTKYFFAITAIDDEQMESLTYSSEVSTTPTAPEAGAIQLLDIRQNWDNEVQLEMSEKIFFAGNPVTAFSVFDKETGGTLGISEIQVLEKQVILILVEDFVPGETYQIVATSEVQNINGLSITEGSMDSIEFVATRFAELPEPKNPEEGEEDEEGETPEEQEDGGGEVEEAKNMALDTSLLKSESLVILSWDIAAEPNMTDQILYTRRGLEDWDSGYSLGNDISELELEVDLDENYEVSIITVNENGVGSAGTSLSFSTSLSATGPETIGTVVALMIVFMIGLIFFKKRHAY